MNRELFLALVCGLSLTACGGGSSGGDTGPDTLQIDTDNDGIPNTTDPDDDNDGVVDSEDAFPLNSAEFRDTDSDGVGDNADTDDDNDGVEDEADAFPLDASETQDNDGDGTGDNADTDDDNDGIEDTQDDLPFDDQESTDTDGDGIGDNTDTDDDNDGTEDEVDAFPLDPNETTDTDGDGTGNNADTDDDNDGVVDSEDAFPLDSSESTDTDGDGIGNNADTDDDNDGVADAQDVFPLDATEWADNDQDGIGNNADVDDDNDGVADHEDAFPFDGSESVDTDGDGIGNNADTDDDNDGVIDGTDAFPLDSSESVDTDNDGIGNNADTDDDNDGVSDALDIFPLDSTESEDADGDGTGNNADTDDDNDGVADTEDDFPFDSTETTDTDGDGTGNNADTDDDNDGVADEEDDLPLDANETVDTDKDGIGNNADTDDDNDGVADSEDQFPLDATESVDTDGDGIGNNADADDDNDGVADSEDAFPLDATESVDTDKDGIGNNADTDDDNDGVSDSDDAFPLDSSETLDTDRDGIGNNTDTDDDNDGVSDSDDQYPTDSTNGGDTDLDGTPNYQEDDDDNDGVVDSKDYFPLDFACYDQSHADHTGTACDSQAAMTAFTPDFTELDSEGNVLVADLSGGIMYRWSVVQGKYLTPIQLASQANTTFEAPTAIRFDKDRQRLWLGFNDGRVVYRTLDDAQHQSFVALDDKIGFIFTSSDYIVTQSIQSSSVTHKMGTYTVDGNEVKSSMVSDSLPPLTYASSVVNNLVHLLDGKDIYHCILDFTSSISRGISCGNNHAAANVTQLASVPGNQILVSGNGEVFYNGHSDAIGNVTAATALTMGEGAERLLLSAVDGKSRLTRYNEQIEPIEMSDFDGTPVGVVNNAATGNILVITKVDNELKFYEHIRQTPSDLDGDGVANYVDAFVADPTASVDSDNDGYPDALHEGTGDRASSLVVDQFKDDTACWLPEHADDKGDCRHGRLVEDAQGISVADSGQDLLFIYDQKQALLHRWSRSSGDYVAPIRLNNSNTVINMPNVKSVFAQQQQRLYLQNLEHKTTYLDLTDSILHDFIQRLAGSDSLAVVGDYVLFNTLGGGDSSPEHSSDVYDLQGQRLSSSVYWGRNLNLAYDKSANKLYQVQDGYVRSLGFNLSDGSLDTGSEQQYKFKSLNFADDVTLSDDNNTLVTASGLVLSASFRMQPIAHIAPHSELKWLSNGGAATISATTQNAVKSTRLERFDSDYQLMESLHLSGEPRGVFTHGDNLLVATQSDKGAPLIHLVTPSLDTDGDNVANSVDAFPDDIAASIDEDDDGYPDSWNSGYGQTDSTGGLVLDAFAGESACQLAEHGTNGECDPTIAQAVFSIASEHTFVDNEKAVYTLDTDSNKLVQINALNGKLENPALLGKLPQAQGLTPKSIYYSKVQRRAYLTYPNEVIGYINMSADYKVERFFAKAPPAGLTTFNMVEAGNYLVVQYAEIDGSTNEAEHYTYALNGELVETRTGIYAEVAAWDSTNNRIVYVEIDAVSNPTDTFKVIESSYHYISQSSGILTQADEKVDSTGLGRNSTWIYLFDDNTKFVDTLGAGIYHLDGMTQFSALASGVSSATDYQDNVLFEQYGGNVNIYGSENIDFRRSMQVCNTDDEIKHIYGANGSAYMLTQHSRTAVIHLVAKGLAPLADERTCYTTLNKWVDTDGDGIGDSIDEDDDNDGYSDAEDAFPLDANEWLDSDNDGIGNNTDTDDDNDGIADIDDDYPLDPQNLLDTDGDGTADVNDSFPNSPDCWLPEHSDNSGDNCDPSKTFEYFDVAFSPTENSQIFDDGQGIVYMVDAKNRKIMRFNAATSDVQDSILIGRDKSVRESTINGIYPAIAQGRIYFHYANETVTYMELTNTLREHEFLQAENKGAFKGLTVAANFVVARYQTASHSAGEMSFYTYGMDSSLVDERTGAFVVQGQWDSSKNRITFVGITDSDTSPRVNLFYSFQQMDSESGKTTQVEDKVNELSVDSRVADAEFIGDTSLFSVQYAGVIHNPDTRQDVKEYTTFVSKATLGGNYIAGQSNHTQVQLFDADDYDFQKTFYSCLTGITIEYLMAHEDKLYVVLSNDELKYISVMRIDLSDLSQSSSCYSIVVDS